LFIPAAKEDYNITHGMKHDGDMSAITGQSIAGLSVEGRRTGDDLVNNFRGRSHAATDLTFAWHNGTHVANLADNGEEHNGTRVANLAVNGEDITDFNNGSDDIFSDDGSQAEASTAGVLNHDTDFAGYELNNENKGAGIMAEAPEPAHDSYHDMADEAAQRNDSTGSAGVHEQVPSKRAGVMVACNFGRKTVTADSNFGSKIDVNDNGNDSIEHPGVSKNSIWTTGVGGASPPESTGVGQIMNDTCAKEQADEATKRDAVLFSARNLQEHALAVAEFTIASLATSRITMVHLILQTALEPFQSGHGASMNLHAFSPEFAPPCFAQRATGVCWGTIIKDGEMDRHIECHPWKSTWYETYV
jgi:hypothetical protein